MGKEKQRYSINLTEKYMREPLTKIPQYAVLEGFADKTTAHGISHIYIAKGLVKKIVWTFFSLISVGTFLFVSETLFEKYFSWPVSVNVAVYHHGELIFPAVSICNMNQVVKDKLDDYLINLASTTTNNSNDNSPITTIDPAESITSEYSPEGDGEGQQQGSSSPIQMNGNFREILMARQHIASLSFEERVQMGHLLGDFLLSCTFAGYDCYYKEEFYQFYNMKYGNCYVYNSGWNIDIKSSIQSELTVSKQTGPQYGLSLIFNIDQSNYFGLLSEAAGVRVVVHPQDVMPFPEDEGVNAMPGTATYIGLRQEQISRLSSPYSSCYRDTNATDDIGKNIYRKEYPVNYTVQACFKTCLQQTTIEQCQCKYILLPLEITKKNISLCDETNHSISTCLHKVYELLEEGNLKCDCPSSCNETLFTSTISTAYWPSEEYKPLLFRDLAKNMKVKSMLKNPDDVDWHKKNLVKVTIYYEELNMKKISESASYPAGQFVSDIGGILGLFIGFSVLTIVEFLELITDCMVLCYLKKLSGTRNQKIQDHNQW